MKQHLIITADDFGYSVNRNRGIAECYKAGAITRSSLMVTGEACQDAIDLAAEIELPMGLHLNLTEGYTVLPAPQVSTLLDTDGAMRGKLGFREALKNGLLDMHQLSAEINAQIRKYCTAVGHKPLYVDGHQHVHILPGICEVFASALKNHDIFETRLPVELGLEKCDWLDPAQRDFYISVTQQAVAAEFVFQKAKIRYSDGFVGMATMGDNMTLNRVTSSILDSFKIIAQRTNEHCKKTSAVTLISAKSTPIRSTTQGSQKTCDISGCETLQVNVTCNSSATILDTSSESNGSGSDRPISYCDKSGTEATVVSENTHSVQVADENCYNTFATWTRHSDISNMENVTLELMVHPGYPSEPGDRGCGTGADEFACSVSRRHEIDVLTSPELRDWYKRNNMIHAYLCQQ